MPLIGRHKPASSSATAQANGSQGKQQVCNSPLFGVRRQWALSGGDGQEVTGTGSCSTPEQSSVPQQITRQQIHYAFSIMDTNKDGMIDLRDLSQMLANLGVPIDEAILSHIMSTVSKRGDHRISEAEFLDWISHFIQIDDVPKATSSGITSKVNKLREAKSLVRLDQSKIARSSTAGSSLAAQQSEKPPARRGSGSGLALMRSLSASSTAPAESGPTTAAGAVAAATGAKSGRATATTQQQAQAETVPSADSEARDDLKAAFRVFDLDGDGYITLDEVRAGLKLLGESWSPVELRQLFNRCSSGSSSVGPASALSTTKDLSKQRISIDDFVHLLL